MHLDTGGANTFAFSGRINGRKLKAGTYELQAVPTFAGKTGATLVASFAIVK
jgi:hypothetical protein